MCKNKKDGGLGLEGLRVEICHCWVKWCWRFLKEQGSLWVSIQHSKYVGSLNSWESVEFALVKLQSMVKSYDLSSYFLVFYKAYRRRWPKY